jgi:hypothetical protein
MRQIGAHGLKASKSNHFGSFIALFAGEHMCEKADDTGVVSWELFNALYENQYDLFRKLKFIVKAGKVDNNESMALEMIEDYLRGKEVDLKDIRQAGLEDWGRRGKTTGLQRFPAPEMPENNGGIGPDKSLVPVVPVSKVSFWSRTLSRNKGE